MPLVYPSVGKAYLGRRNVQDRVAYCRCCGRRAELASYTTDLWYVLAFVPIIPLGRKRVFDLCPACYSHFSCSWKEWEMIRQLDLSGAVHAFRKTPNPETAIELHQLYRIYHCAKEATQLEQRMFAEYSQNARAMTYLGASLMEQGEHQKALDYYRRALALRPDLPEAKIALAFEAIRNNKLGEARFHLAFLEEPGAEHVCRMEPLDVLARAFVDAGRPEEALQLYAKLLDAFPDAGQDKNLRKYIRSLEKKAGKKRTILPRRKLFGTSGNQNGPGKAQQVLRWTGVIAIVAALTFALDRMGREHRSLYLFNASSQAAEVIPAGDKPVLVEPGVKQIFVSERLRQIQLTAPGPKSMEINLETPGILAGIFSRPSWMIDTGGDALLVREERTYASDPKTTSIDHFLYGRRFYPIPDSDLLFEAFPEASRFAKLTRFGSYSGTAADAVGALLKSKREAEALDLAEWRLSVVPEDQEVFRLYGRYAFSGEQGARVRAFLERGLSRRPVITDWHRVYQDALLRNRERPQLAALYDGMLKQEPENAALLYLRARLAEHAVEARALLEQSVRLDLNNTYTNYALAYQEMLEARFAEAAALFRRASEIEPGNAAFLESWLMAERAAGNVAIVEEICRGRIEEQGANPAAAAALIDALVSQARLAEAGEVVSRTDTAASGGQGSVSDGLRLRFLYESGQFAELQGITAADASPRGREYQIASLLELGKLDEAERIAAASSGGDPFDSLMFAIARMNSDANKTAENHRQRAIQWIALDPDPDMQRTADLLRREKAPSSAELDDIVISLKGKTLLCVWLALKFPQERERFAAMAERLNIALVPPHRLVERALAAPPPAAPRKGRKR